MNFDLTDEQFQVRDMVRVSSRLEEVAPTFRSGMQRASFIEKFSTRWGSLDCSAS